MGGNAGPGDEAGEKQYICWDMGLKSLSEMLVLNLETLSVELLKIFSAKTEHSSGLTFYY